MTGQRRIRGRLDDDRHGRPDRRDPAPVGGHVELVELTVVRVMPGRRSRIGLSAIVAAGSLAVLLAAGFGALGGKPSASQAAAAANATGASASRPGPTVPGLEPAVAPEVTPWAACSAPPSGVPNVVLQANGMEYAGRIEASQATSGVVPPPTAVPQRGPISVSSNVPADLWIEGASCANAWTIMFATEQLDVVGNAGLNPQRVAQNRFRLFLAPYGGSTAELTAELIFQTGSFRATWPIHVEPYEHPFAILSSGTGGALAVEGCGTGLTLHDGWYLSDQRCSDAMADPPEGSTPVEPAGQLSFSIESWTIDTASFECGTLSGREFLPDARAKCDDGDIDIDGIQADLEGRILIQAPRTKGTWTLAIQACASKDDWFGHNQICGTWYANAEVSA